MKIHEYQAKALFRRYGIPVLPGAVAGSSEEAVGVAQDLGSGPWVVKAQVHAGGRGKGGGIRLCRSTEEIRTASREILSRPLVTPQTGPQGKTVRKLLVEAACEIDRELYLAAVLDRATGSVAVMASREGGVDIEEVAARSPEKIFKVHADPALGFSPYQARSLAAALGLGKELGRSFADVTAGLVRLFLEKDASLAEINPLVVTKAGTLIALDAKVNFDDSGLPRHEDIRNLADSSEEDPLDVEAARWGLNYIHLDGNIGCMVNGAGLAMATMDIIQLAGGQPANFLDVGGGASADAVREAFKLLVLDPKVKAILVNIFGGILRCDVLAQGIAQAAKGIRLTVPLVVRLEGTNVDEGRKILAASGLGIRSASGMTEAARLAISLAGGA